MSHMTAVGSAGSGTYCVTGGAATAPEPPFIHSVVSRQPPLRALRCFSARTRMISSPTWRSRAASRRRHSSSGTSVKSCTTKVARPPTAAFSRFGMCLVRWVLSTTTSKPPSTAARTAASWTARTVCSCAKLRPRAGSGRSSMARRSSRLTRRIRPPASAWSARAAVVLPEAGRPVMTWTTGSGASCRAGRPVRSAAGAGIRGAAPGERVGAAAGVAGRSRADAVRSPSSERVRFSASEPVRCAAPGPVLFSSSLMYGSAASGRTWRQVVSSVDRPSSRMNIAGRTVRSGSCATARAKAPRSAVRCARPA